jgi:hypothetical protein
MKKVGIRGTVGLFVLATFAAMVLLIVSGAVIASLPRARPGGPVLAPFSLCAILSLCISLLVPWFVVCIFIPTRRLRVCLFFGLAGTVAMWYFGFGFSQTLFKAYYWGGG